MESKKYELPYGLPAYHPTDDRYSSFSSEDICAPLDLNLTFDDNSSLATNGHRRPSFDSIELSVNSDLLSASSIGTVSPSTPLNDCSFSSSYMEAFRSAAPQVNLHAMLNQQQGDFAEHDFGFSPAVSKEQSGSKYFNAYSMDVHDAFYTPSTHGLSNEGISTALSRPMFHETIPSATTLTMDSHTLWPSVTVAHTPPRTIDPSTFGSFVLNTPTFKTETPCTPSRQHQRSYMVLGSSPMLDCTPNFVPSQHEVNDSAYLCTSNIQETFHLTYERLGLEEHHRTQSRLARRRYARKGSSSGCKRRPLANKSGFECDRIITANSFACSYPECIDKNTGKQKRFKRQEHKKRHEKTVHQKESQSLHKCWVPQCERSFSRTDNLKSHLKNTHGKRSPNARNRYVATLDPNSQYFCPDWEGDLTTEGLPVD